MSISRIKELERHRLSNGGLAIVNRLGWSYSFVHIIPGDMFTPPEDYHGLTKDQAYTMLEECLKNDVLEVD
jgi:hypothetical protein